jgi:hypothetical protein
MTRTQRIYNRVPLKASLRLKGWILSQDRKDLIRYLDEEDGWWIVWDTIYHPFKYLCMGHCKFCKDRMKGKRRRLEYQRDFRERLKKGDEIIP